MAVNKVVANGKTILDLSQITLSEASQLASGVVAHGRNGEILTGTAASVGNHDIETFEPIKLASSYTPATAWGAASSNLATDQTYTAKTDDINAVACDAYISACGNVCMFTFSNLTIRYGKTVLNGDTGDYAYKQYQYTKGTQYLLFKIPVACAPVANCYYFPGTFTRVNYFVLTTNGEFKICFASNFNSAAKDSSDTNAGKATSAGYQTNLTNHDQYGGFMYWRSAT